MATDYPSIADLIVKNIRHGQHWNKKHIGLSDAEWQPLLKDTYIGQNVFPAGTQFKVFETINFGWLVLHKDARTIEGAIPYRRIYKW